MAKDKYRQEKKRKYGAEKPEINDQSDKEPTLSIEPLKVNIVDNPEGPVPVIATTPGVTLPTKLPLKPYTKTRPKRLAGSKFNPSIRSSELLLQSSNHPRLDFIARENDLDQLWNHYVAIYDPATGSLEFIEARKMTVHGSVRPPSIPDDKEKPVTVREQRNALTEAFGTKQSIRTARSLAENALLSNSTGAPNAVESALLSSMSKDELSASPQKKAEAEIQAAKPIPQGNREATTPADAYPLETLVPGGLAILRSMPVKEWQDAVTAGVAVITTSRFVAHRVEPVVQGGNRTTLQLLRFILVLIEFARCLKNSRGGADGKSGGPGSKRLPPREELRTALAGLLPPAKNQSQFQGSVSSSQSQFVTDPLLDILRRRFAPHGAFLTKTDVTLLHTTICALTLHIPPPGRAVADMITAEELVTDPADLRDDLRLDTPLTLQYYRELGCRISKLRESELAAFGVRGKADANARRVARLRLPLEFPKVSRGGGKR